MNGFYDLMLFLFIFGLAAGAVNEIGAFDTSVPDPGVKLDESTVTEVHEGALNQTSSDFSVWEVILSFMRVIGSGVLAMFTVLPAIVSIFQMAGADVTFAYLAGGLIQAPITFVTLFGLYEWWTGRSVT